MNRMLKTSLVLVALLLSACVSVPTGPSVMSLPGTGKSFEQFRYDQSQCRGYASEQIGGTSASQVANNAAVSSAAVGTLVGAAAGAALGGRDGAGAGAGVGLLMGSAAGSGAAQSSAYGTQRHYDNAFIQCMYSKGHKVPVSGRLSQEAMPAAAYPPPPPGAYALPPPPPNRGY